MSTTPNSMNDAPRNRQEDLDRAKQEFAARMMDNETFFGLVGRRIGQPGHMFHGFSADQITYEPTWRFLNGRRAQIGIRLNADRSLQPVDASGVHVNMALYDYIEFAVVDLSNRPAELDAVDASTMAEIRAMQDPQLSPAEAWAKADDEAITLLETWQAGWETIISGFGDATLEPHSGTVELRQEDMGYSVAARLEPDGPQWN